MVTTKVAIQTNSSNKTIKIKTNLVLLTTHQPVAKSLLHQAAEATAVVLTLIKQLQQQVVLAALSVTATHLNNSFSYRTKEVAAVVEVLLVDNFVDAVEALVVLEQVCM